MAKNQNTDLDINHNIKKKTDVPVFKILVNEQ